MNSEEDMTAQEIHEALLRRGITEISLEKAKARVHDAVTMARVKDYLEKMNFNLEKRKIP